MTDDRDRPTKPPAPPGPPRPRQGSHPRLVAREELAPGAVRLPGAKPPPAPQRARPLEQTLTGSPAPPSGKVIDAVFEEDSRPTWGDEVTERGVPRPQHPPRSISPPPRELAATEPAAESARAEGAAKAELADERQARLKAEARAAELELQAAASKAAPRGPSLSVSFGAAKWWTLVLAALAGVFHEMPKGLDALARFLNWPTHEQIEAQAKRSDELESAAKKRQEANDKAQTAAADQARIVEAFLCAQGLRADGLDCDVALARAKFEQQPLTGPNKIRGAPQFKTRLVWPQARAPPEQ